MSREGWEEACRLADYREGLLLSSSSQHTSTDILQTPSCPLHSKMVKKCPYYQQVSQWPTICFLMSLTFNLKSQIRDPSGVLTKEWRKWRGKRNLRSALQLLGFLLFGGWGFSLFPHAYYKKMSFYIADSYRTTCSVCDSNVGHIPCFNPKMKANKQKIGFQKSCNASLMVF